MTRPNDLRYDNLSLKDLAERLHLNYYEILSSMIRQATILLGELKHTDLHQTTQRYTNICSQVLECMQLYLHDRREQLVPYMNELHEKDDNLHDCSTCEGNCNVRHYSYLMNLQESHGKLRKLFYELQTGALPLYSSTVYPAVYRKLRDEMLLIDAIARELMYIEEAEMIPKIVQSQKKINVRPH